MRYVCLESSQVQWSPLIVSTLKKNIFSGVPYLATFISFFIEYVIASIAYIHPVYGAGVRTHDLLDVSILP